MILGFRLQWTPPGMFTPPGILTELLILIPRQLLPIILLQTEAKKYLSLNWISPETSFGQKKSGEHPMTGGIQLRLTEQETFIPPVISRERLTSTQVQEQLPLLPGALLLLFRNWMPTEFLCGPNKCRLEIPKGKP